MEKYRFSAPLQIPRAMHYGNNYWVFYSPKLHRRVTAFSNLEYENLITLEMNPNVEYYCEHPIEINIVENGKNVTAKPDVWVLYKDGTEEIQDVRYAEELEELSEDCAKNTEPIRREGAWAEENGFRFQIRTDKVIHNGEYYFRNLEFLFGHLRGNDKFTKVEEKNLLKSISKLRTIRDVCILFDSDGSKALDIIAVLYSHGKIQLVGIESRPIQYTTEVVVNE